MKTRILLLILFASHLSQAQDAPFLPDSVTSILQEVLSGETAKRNLEFIATLHRQRGSADFNTAVKFIASKLKEYGLEDIEMFQIPADGSSMYGTQKSRMAWEATSALLWEMEKSAEGWRPSLLLADYSAMPIVLAEDSESAEVTAELVDIGAGTTDKDFEAKDVKGKLVLTSSSPSSVVEIAVNKYGAAGILSYTQNQRTAWWKEDTNLIRWGHFDSFATTKSFCFMLSLKQAAAFQQRLQRGEKIVLRASVKAGQHKGNYDFVTAVIKGSDPVLKDQEIALTCHLDHQRPGANDNASGSMTILEIARTLEQLIGDKQIARPKRTIRFIWSPEIEGTSAILSQRPQYASKIKAVIHMDMVGGGPITKSVFHVAGAQKSLPSFVADVGAAFGQFLNDQSDLYASGYDYKYPFVSMEGGKEPLQAIIGEFHLGSDHEIYGEGSFGIPFIYLHDWPDRYIHTNFDMAQNIDPTKLLRAGFIGAASAFTLASLDKSYSKQLLNTINEQCLRRTADAKKIAASWRETDQKIFWKNHFDFERGVFNSATKFVEFTSDEKAKALSFFASLAAAVNQPGVSASVKTRGTVYTRNAEIKGPMTGFGYNYLSDHLGEEAAAALKLLNYNGKGDYYGYEALNFVDGKRTTMDIKDALSSEFGSIPLEFVEEYLSALERVGVIKR